VRWEAFSTEAEARERLRGELGMSMVLFGPDGVPACFSCVRSDDGAIILAAHGNNGETPDRDHVAEAVRAGDAPFVPPDRPPVVQWVLKRTMEASFTRRTVSFISSFPLPDTSLCYFDVAQHPGVRGFVAVTIDDAPCRFGQASSKVSDVGSLLKMYGARATFMVIGSFLEAHEADMVDLLRDGHELANHGMLDRAYHLDDAADFARAVDECSTRICRLQRAAGLDEGVRWFRAPHAKYTRSMESVLASRGLTNVMCDSYASCPVVQDGEYIGKFLAERARHGSIIVIHMPEHGFREWCLVGLRHLLAGLHKRGMQSVTVGELVGKAEGSACSDTE